MVIGVVFLPLPLGEKGLVYLVYSAQNIQSTYFPGYPYIRRERPDSCWGARPLSEWRPEGQVRARKVRKHCRFKHWL